MSMSHFLFRLQARAVAYRQALNELSQLAAAGDRGVPGLFEAVKRLAGDLSFSRASLLQIAMTDSLLRNDVEQELRRIVPQSPRDYVLEIRRNPRLVMRLPGYWRVRDRMAASVRTDESTVDGLFLVMMQYLKLIENDWEFPGRQVHGRRQRAGVHAWKLRERRQERG